MKYRTSRAFTRAPDLDLSMATGKVITGLTGNPGLAAPPVSAVELTAEKDTYDDWIIKADRGGSLAHAQKVAARGVVVNSMSKNASYVDINCGEDLALLLSSGFEPVSTNRTQVVLQAPEVIAAVYVQAGKIRLRVKGDPNRKAIQGRIKPLDGKYGPVIPFKNAREVIFEGLVAGITYVMQLSGLGGSTGMSDWSEPVTKVAI